MMYINMKKFLNFNKVLCLSPHPDDTELSMSGAINKFTDTLFDILCLTNGTSTDSSNSIQRYEEVKNFWNSMNCSNVNVLNSGINYFESLSAAQWITYLDNIVSNGYDAIFTTSREDAHQEHIFVNSLVPALTRNNPISIIEYKSPSTLHTWIPNYFVECELNFNLKCNALRNSFKSQIDSTYFTEECIRTFHTDYNCYKRNLHYVEQFKIITLYN